MSVCDLDSPQRLSRRSSLSQCSPPFPCFPALSHWRSRPATAGTLPDEQSEPIDKPIYKNKTGVTHPKKPNHAPPRSFPFVRSSLRTP